MVQPYHSEVSDGVQVIVGKSQEVLLIDHILIGDVGRTEDEFTYPLLNLF